MAQKMNKKPVKGGWVARSAKTGRFVSVVTEKGLSRSSTTTVRKVEDISSRRSAALKRLADR